MTTVEQEAADAALYAAIVEHARAYEMGGYDGELLDQYAVIATWQPEEDRGRTRYTVAYNTPTVPGHVALGLFHIAIGFIDQEDDE